MSVRTLTPKKYLEEKYPGSGITTVTVHNWCRKGYLPYVLTPSGNLLVLVDDNSGL
ncbi:hypothetical protein ITG13_08575 [Vibrio cyclitrophicus]|nr:hypothetical protein [Vibrio cyclitrophicus]UPR34026.1 hypothetical protein ISX50_13185 [Vibrio cyclitrophicus]UPR46413.1 hypothetical protein ITG13_08575 [Vibrio cyclitrophicus]